MILKTLMRSFLILFAALAVSLPAQSAMVATAQIQGGSLAADFSDVSAKREWIESQLIAGGVDQAAAQLRVASMTDMQVAQLHQRIDQQPAGGNAVVVLIAILLFTELMGYTDILPFIRPVE